MSDVEGSCHCGAIKLRIVGGFGDNAKAVACHCNVCTTLAGSLFSYLAPVPRSNLQVLEGTAKGYKQPTSDNVSGKQVTRYFCGDRSTPLWAESEAAPGGCFVKLAPFGNKLPPGAELFWKNAYEWQNSIVAPEAVFDMLPPPS